MNLLNGTLVVQNDGVRFAGTHFTLDVSRYPFREAPAAGRPCVLGVRPEDVRVHIGNSGESGESGADTAAHAGERAKVSLVEPMGNHRVIWLDYHGAQIASIDQQKTPVAVGETTAFTVDGAHISLFDEASSMRL
jgi:multiple sugar transport system ATP-binding protein